MTLLLSEQLATAASSPRVGTPIAKGKSEKTSPR